MDKLIDTVKAIMEQGGPLAEKAMFYWFMVRGADAVSNIAITLIIIIGIASTIRYIVRAVERDNAKAKDQEKSKWEKLV